MTIKKLYMINFLLLILVIISLIFRYYIIPTPVVMTIILFTLSPIVFMLVDKNQELNILYDKLDIMWFIFLLIAFCLSFIDDPIKKSKVIDEEIDDDL